MELVFQCFCEDTLIEVCFVVLDKRFVFELRDFGERHSVKIWILENVRSPFDFVEQIVVGFIFHRVAQQIVQNDFVVFGGRNKKLEASGRVVSGSKTKEAVVVAVGREV